MRLRASLHASCGLDWGGTYTVVFSNFTGWRGAAYPRDACDMADVPLSDDELARAALGARAMAYMHEQKAQRSEDPALHSEQARRFRALAERLENARTSAGRLNDPEACSIRCHEAAP